MKKRISFLVASFLVCLGTSAYAQRPDFSGAWRLDQSASEITTGSGLAGLGGHAPANLYITQRGTSVIIASRLPGSEPRAYEMDGETWVEPPRPGNRQFLIRSRIRGLTMISEGTGDVGGEFVTVREVLTMHPSGSNITLEVTTTRSDGAETNKLVYTRAGGGGAP
jgi:hypothetical protein